MSTIKISELSEIHPLNPNTGEVSIVVSDTQTGITGRITATTLSEGLYANNVLNVGNNSILFPGVIGQFVSNNESYLQVNLQNLRDTGSSDFVAMADIGTDTQYFIDVGIQGSNLEQGVLGPLDGYLLVQGDGPTNPGANLVIGTLSQNRNIIFTEGGYYADNVIAQFTHNTGFHLVKKPLTFADGTSQNTSFAGAATAANTGIAYAQSAGSYANSAYGQANTATAYGTSAGSYANSAYDQANTATAYAQSAGSYANSAFIVANNTIGINATQNTNIQLAWNEANTSVQNTSTITISNHLIVPGNLTVYGISTEGNTAINNGITIGDGGLYQYSTANNTTVTQSTTKNNPVTCNGRTGQITTAGDSLAGGRSATFKVNNSQIVSATDVVIVNIASGDTSGNTYGVSVTTVSPGYFNVTINNVSGSAQTNTLVLNYAILRVN